MYSLDKRFSSGLFSLEAKNVGGAKASCRATMNVILEIALICLPTMGRKAKKLTTLS